MYLSLYTLVHDYCSVIALSSHPVSIFKSCFISSSNLDQKSPSRKLPRITYIQNEFQLFHKWMSKNRSLNHINSISKLTQFDWSLIDQPAKIDFKVFDQSCLWLACCIFVWFWLKCKIKPMIKFVWMLTIRLQTNKHKTMSLRFHLIQSNINQSFPWL